MEIKLNGHILHIGQTTINVPLSLGANDLSKEEGKALCDLINEKDERIAELQDFAIWMTGCGYEFTQHEYFNNQRDRLLLDKIKGGDV